MCTTCGCSEGSHPTLTDLQTGHRVMLGDAHHHDHDHGHDHSHDHGHSHGAPFALRTHAVGRTIELERDLLAKNNVFAERNRGWLAGRRILALNLVSAPGAGKTSLIERTIRDLGRELLISVVEGDQATLQDAERIGATGARVVQINTGTGCHLEADMTARALVSLDPPAGSVVLIENVGNLVCPALFDLGEAMKVVVASVTDGEDKPLKYPHIYRAAGLILLNKIDLLPHVSFSVERFTEFARQVNGRAQVRLLSATTGEGLEGWYGWLRARVSQKGPALYAPL